MKKHIKIILIICITIITLIILDFISIFIINRPLIIIKNSDYKYSGLLYNVYNCPGKSKPQIKSKWSKFECNKNINKNRVVDIIDKTSEIPDLIIAQALELFYEDENNKYYYSSMKGNYIVVKYENGFEETVEEALKKGTIKIDDLDRYSINYIISTKTTTQSKKTIKEIIDKTVGMSCASVMETFYEDEAYEYQFGCEKSDSVIVIYEDGEEESVKSALENRNIKISDLNNFDIKYFIVEK